MTKTQTFLQLNNFPAACFSCSKTPFQLSVGYILFPVPYAASYEDDMMIYNCYCVSCKHNVNVKTCFNCAVKGYEYKTLFRCSAIHMFSGSSSTRSRVCSIKTSLSCWVSPKLHCPRNRSVSWVVSGLRWTCCPIRGLISNSSRDILRPDPHRYRYNRFKSLSASLSRPFQSHRGCHWWLSPSAAQILWRTQCQPRQRTSQPLRKYLLLTKVRSSQT